jgi:hypothetical protein
MRIGRANLTLGLAMLLLCGRAAPQSDAGYPAAPGPWKQLAKLTEASGKESDLLGWSVALSKDGNTVAVGAVGWCRLKNADGCGQGAVFVFVSG